MGDMFISAEPVLQISHSDDDLFLTGFTFDEVQTLEMEDFYRDFVAMSFDQHGDARYDEYVLSSRHGVRATLAWAQWVHGNPDLDVPFRLGFIPTEVDYRYMARLSKERVKARLTHTSFDYPIRPYTMSLADYFVRALEPQTPSQHYSRGWATAPHPSASVEWWSP